MKQFKMCFIMYYFSSKVKFKALREGLNGILERYILIIFLLKSIRTLKDYFVITL